MRTPEKEVGQTLNHSSQEKFTQSSHRVSSQVSCEVGAAPRRRRSRRLVTAGLMGATEADLIATAGVAVAGSEVVDTVVASAAVVGAEVVGTAVVAAAADADAAADRPRLDNDARELKLQQNQIASSLAAGPTGTALAAAKPKLGGSNFIFSVCLGLFAVGFAAVHGQQSALSNMLSRPPLPLPSPPSKLFGLF